MGWSGRGGLVGKSTKIYWNLHKHEFSIVQDGLVVRHLDYFEIQDCVLRVQPAGKDKVRKEKKKNIHAYVQGMPCGSMGGKSYQIGEATYNPYKYDSFVMVDTGEPIYEADHIWLGSYLDKGERKPEILIYKYCIPKSQW